MKKYILYAIIILAVSGTGIFFVIKNIDDKSINIENNSNKIKVISAEAVGHNILGLKYYNVAKFELEAKRKFNEASIEYEEAANEFRKAIEISPNYSDAHYNLGRVYLFQKKYEDLINEYEKFVELKPKDMDSHIYLASAYEKTERYDDAIKELKKAISLADDEIVIGRINEMINEIKKNKN